MYVFKEFNKTHARDVLISFASYVVILTIVFWGGYFLIDDVTSLVSVSVAILLGAHITRIVQIIRSNQAIVLTWTQNAVVLIAILAIIFFVAYAYANSSSRFIVGTSSLLKLVFLPLLLASVFSVWVDFAIARLFVEKH